MNKLVFLAGFFLAVLIVLSVGAYAIGVSTSTSVSPSSAQAKSASTSASKADSTSTRTAMKSRVSVKLTDAKSRYLSVKKSNPQAKPSSAVSANAVSEDITDESCLNLEESKRDSCRKLYRDSASCYEKEGRARAVCLREKSGFASRAGISDSSKETRQRYAILLLYHLQEKVENRFFNDEISNEKASDLITKIVEIKAMILEDKPSEDIRKELADLRGMWA